MIVRILGEGQFEVDETSIGRLEALDTDLGVALGASDEVKFQDALAALSAAVRSLGRPLDAATIVPSDLVVPTPGSSLAEVQALLASEDAADGGQTTSS